VDDSTAIVVIVAVLAFVATVMALVAFIRGAKVSSDDLAGQFSLSSASDLAKAEGLRVGDSVVLTTNRGGRKRFGVVTKVFANEDVLVEIDDSTGRFTTRRPAAAFRR